MGQRFFKCILNAIRMRQWVARGIKAAATAAPVESHYEDNL